jgi:nitronate monooxygenase
MRPLFGILFTSTVTAMKNALTSLFPWVDLPLISPPMANVSGGRLAARVSRAGALGFIGIGHVPDPQGWLAKELAVVRAELGVADETERLRVGAGFFVWKLELMDRADAEALLRWTAPRVACIWRSFGTHTPEWVRVVKDMPEARGCALAVLVNTVQEVRAVMQPGRVPELLVAQSLEAGGHGSPHALPLVSLVPAVVDALRAYEAKPLVVAAGGISSGAQLVAAVALGADAGAAGTLFAAAEEAAWLPTQKMLLAAASGEDTVRTKVFDEMQSGVFSPCAHISLADQCLPQRDEQLARSHRWEGGDQSDFGGHRVWTKRRGAHGRICCSRCQGRCGADRDVGRHVSWRRA